MSEFSTFPPTVKETDDGEIVPSYQPGNGNEPRYVPVDTEMPHDSNIGTGENQPEPLPVRTDDEGSRGDFLDNNGTPFRIEPAAAGHEDDYGKGIREAREELQKR